MKGPSGSHTKHYLQGQVLSISTVGTSRPHLKRKVRVEGLIECCAYIQKRALQSFRLTPVNKAKGKTGRTAKS